VEAKSVARKSWQGKEVKCVELLGIELKRVEDGAKFWQCLICKRVQKKSIIYSATATTSPFRHLKVEHGVVERNKRFVRLEQEEVL
jgi:hypothetical protein